MSDFEQGANQDAVPVGTDLNLGTAEVLDDNEATVVDETIDGSATQETEETVGPEFNANDWPMKFRDNTVFPKDRDDLIRLAQMGHGYSNKMNQLKQQAAEQSQTATRYEQLEKLISEIQRDPEFKDYILGYKKPEGSPEQTTDINAQVQAALAPHLQQVTSIQQQLEDQKADGDLEVETAELKTKYPDADWESKDTNGNTLMQDVWQRALDADTSLELAYRDITYDSIRNNTEAETIKKNQAAEAEKVNQGVVTSSGSQVAPAKKKGYDRGKSWNETAESALEEYRKM